MEDVKIINYQDGSSNLEINSNLFRLSQIMKKKVCIFNTNDKTLSAEVFEFSFKESENPYKIIVEIKCCGHKTEKEINICELAKAVNAARLNGEYPPNSYRFRNILFRFMNEFMKENIPDGIMINDFIRNSNILIYNGENILAAIKESTESETDFMNISTINDNFEIGSAVTPGEYVSLDFYGYKKRTNDYPVFTVINFKFEEIFTRKDFVDKFLFVIYNQSKDAMIVVEAKKDDNVGILKIVNKELTKDFYNTKDIIKENYNNPEAIIENIINNKNINNDMNFLFSIE